MYKKVYSSEKVNISEEDILRRKRIARTQWFNRHFQVRTIVTVMCLGIEHEITEENSDLFGPEFKRTTKTVKVFIP